MLGAVLGSVATIFGPPANNLFGPLAKGLRRLLLPGGPLAGPSSPAAPLGRGACGGALDTPLAVYFQTPDKRLLEIQYFFNFKCRVPMFEDPGAPYS